MPNKSSVFEKTYKDYLTQIVTLDLKSIAHKLKIELEGDEVIIPLFGKPHRVSQKGINDPSGKQPSLDVSVIIFKYLLMCPDTSPTEKEWVSYRDFKDSGPLTTYFTNDVERAIVSYFTGKLSDMEIASKTLGGYLPDIKVTYDLSIQFDALPQVPILMLFNDADDEFPAKCSVLFQRRAEKYLDPESLSMVGRLLFLYLKKAATYIGRTSYLN
jgi:hypothetical protein